MRWGIIAAITMALLGAFIFLINHGSESVAYNQFIEDDVPIKTILKNTWNGLLSVQGSSYIMLGILLLFATPLIRVVFSLIVFIIEKDKMYILITLIVLSIIFISINGGFAH